MFNHHTWSFEMRDFQPEHIVPLGRAVNHEYGLSIRHFFADIDDSKMVRRVTVEFDHDVSYISSEKVMTFIIGFYRGLQATMQEVSH